MLKYSIVFQNYYRVTFDEIQSVLDVLGVMIIVLSTLYVKF